MLTPKNVAIFIRLLSVGSHCPFSHRLITDFPTPNSLARATCPNPFSILSSFSLSANTSIHIIFPQKWEKCLTFHYNGNIIFIAMSITFIINID